MSTKLAKKNQSQVFTQEFFPMHCVKIDDLLKFDRMYNHEEVKEMGKFVIPSSSDDRPIMFISHQWTAYDHPDPQNVQFRVLQKALRRLLDGEDVYPTEIQEGVAGMPKSMNFTGTLKDCLCWLDYISVPQLRCRHQLDSESYHSQDGQDDEDEENEEAQALPSPLEDMLNATNSIPAYVQRSNIMLCLAPVVRHAETQHDTQFSSWRNRGWCRLEAVAGSLVGAANFMILVEGESKVSLFTAGEMLVRDAVGQGEFACCARNHIIEVDGVQRKIPCDRDKVSAVLTELMTNQLEVLAKQSDLAEYRWVLAHHHIIMKGMPGAESHAETMNTWAKFSAAFRFDPGKPLATIDGALFSPFMYAVMANNLPVVRKLLNLKASVKEFMHHSASSYQGYSPMHLIMKNGHGSDGTEIFDLLLKNGADPYHHARSAKGVWHRDPLCTGVSVENVEMVKHYLEKVGPKFSHMADQYKGRNDIFAVAKGNYEIVKLFHNYEDRDGEKLCEFQSKNIFGMDALSAFILAPKDFQFNTDIRVLDLLYDHKLLGDLDRKVFNPSGLNAVIQNTMWHLKNKGFFKTNVKLQNVYNVFGGTPLHAAVYRDKPEAIKWLIEHKADPSKKNKRGMTPLQLAECVKSDRCISLLKSKATRG